jgi:hypothetical protein
MIDGAKPFTDPTAMHIFVAAHETEGKKDDEVGVVTKLQTLPSQCIINGRRGFDVEVPIPTHMVVVTQETETKRSEIIEEIFGDGTLVQETPSHFNTSV